MAGKFINTQRNDIINNLIEGVNNKLDHQYYKHMDKKATIVDYYKINIDASTLDEALKTYYELLGSKSPIRYNKISNFYIYGFEKISLGNSDLGDMGIEHSGAEGEAIILPNTIIPIPGDFFVIKQAGKEFLFKVIDSHVDTLESGANMYKIEYKYDDHESVDIKDQIVQYYHMIIDNIGTDFKPIILSNDYNLIEIYDDLITSLKDYYIALFFNERVESFTFNIDCRSYFYDPYLTEFLIRNKLITGSSKYIYLKQQIHIPTSFVIDYDKTIFRDIELNRVDKLPKKLGSIGEYVNDMMSLLYMRSENYFTIKYKEIDEYTKPLEVESIPQSLYDNIKNNVRDNTIQDIIVKYFNKEDIIKDDIKLLEDLDYNDSVLLYYYIPLIIYIVEQNIKKLLFKKGVK